MWLNAASDIAEFISWRPLFSIILLLDFAHIILCDVYNQYSYVDDGSDIRCGHPKYARVPCFDDRVKSNLVVKPGDRAVLQCIIFNAKMKAVTWDKKDEGPIAIGTSIFLRDPRISVRRGKSTDWSLVIERVRKSDAGEYTCQINLEKIKEKVFHLKVEAPTTDTNSNEDSRGTHSGLTNEYLKDQGLRGSEIKRKSVVIAGRDVVNTGETLVLTCTAIYRQSMSSNAALEWYHFGIWKRTSPREGLSISQQMINATAMKSILRLSPVTPESSGPWVCVKRPSDNGRRESSEINVTVVRRYYSRKATNNYAAKNGRLASSCLLPTKPVILLLLALETYHFLRVLPRLHEDGVL